MNSAVRREQVLDGVMTRKISSQSGIGHIIELDKNKKGVIYPTKIQDVERGLDWCPEVVVAAIRHGLIPEEHAEPWRFLLNSPGIMLDSMTTSFYVQYTRLATNNLVVDLRQRRPMQLGAVRVELSWPSKEKYSPPVVVIPWARIASEIYGFVPA